nr:TIGR02594 family protein [Hyphomicrobium sp.]
TETAGGADNERIVGYFRQSGHPEIGDDETPWCAAFVGAMIEKTGHRSAASLRARSYLNWGVTIDGAKLGAIAILSRGGNSALGHVGFVVGATDDALILLGGNQSNSVSVQSFKKTRLLGLRWPQATEPPVEAKPKPEAGVLADTGGAFETALGHVLEMEGGFNDDPFDPGGPTNYGITLRTYANYTGRTIDAGSRALLLAELIAIRPETVRDIYLKRYWTPARCEELPAGLALMHFDAAVNHGVGAAIRCLQMAVHAAADGEIGPFTRRAIDEASPCDAVARYAALREKRYRALPHFWRFGRGWLRRVRKTKAAALAVCDRAQGPPRITPLSASQTNGDIAMTPSQPPSPKWWGHSLTVWGAAVTAAAAILPALGPLIGLDITSETVRQIGSDVGAIAQAVAGVVGTLMTLYGRSRATAPLIRREVNVRL